MAVGGAALVMALATPLATSVAPAGAAGDTIAAAGSDTTQDVMDQILSGTGAVNVHVPKATVGDVTLPADSFANSVTFNATGTGTDGGGNPKIIPPANSGEGRAALDNSVAKTYPGAFAYTGIASSTGGVIDIARSSSRGNGTTQQSFAFAVDAVGWASTSLNAPANLSLQDLRDIWNCNINDWSQVGGSPGPIQRVLPKFGSGTRKYFLNNVIGVPSSGSQPVETDTVGWQAPNAGTVPAGHPGAGTAITCPAAIGSGNSGGVEENVGNELSLPSTRVDYQKYIFPYSSGKWVQQATGAGNPTVDVRNGVRPGGIVGVAPSGSFPAAYSVRWTGTAWSLNDGTILGSNATGARSVSVTAAAQFATTVTAAPGTFTAADVGLNLQGSFVNDGTTILTVAGDGSSATISPGAKAAGSGSVLLGWSVVSEKNPNLFGAGTGNGLQYPGVRFVYNVLRPDSPSYNTARDLVAFADVSGGAISPLCNGTDEGLIADAGFLPLKSIDPTGPGAGNDTPVTCRKQ